MCMSPFCQDIIIIYYKKLIFFTTVFGSSHMRGDSRPQLLDIRAHQSLAEDHSTAPRKQGWGQLWDQFLSDRCSWHCVDLSHGLQPPTVQVGISTRPGTHVRKLWRHRLWPRVWPTRIGNMCINGTPCLYTMKLRFVINENPIFFKLM